jgi:LacI family transcriptional regulator
VQKIVAVFMNEDAGASAELLRGVARFARSREDWLLISMGTTQADLHAHPDADSADGLLVQTADASELKSLVANGIPAVNLLQTPPPLKLPAVCADNESAGRLAAEHLLNLGLRRFGYLDAAAAADNAFRQRGFAETIEASQGRCAVREISSLWEKILSKATVAAVKKWIESIGRPCGILAFNDSLGSPFIRAARAAGFRVPEDVAVVGFDDHDVLCEFCNPPLSSVNCNNQVIGYEAAALLDRLMRGRRKAAPTQRLIPPIGVIERKSSQMLAVEDDVARVLRLMMRHLDQRLTVREMAEHIQVSERTLETKFQRSLGRSPSEEMARLRVERAKQLLVDTDKSVQAVAFDSGFATSSHFCHAFKQTTSCTPSQYRRGLRGKAAGRD